MSGNLILDIPPVQTTFIDEKNKKNNSAWVQWLDNFHFLSQASRNSQTITQASPINLDSNHISLDSTSGAYAVTLGAPTKPNVDMTIEMTVKGSSHNITLALTNVVGGTASTTCTFNTQGGSLILKSKATKWHVMNQYNITLT